MKESSNVHKQAVEKSWLRALLAPLSIPEQVLVLLMWEQANATSFYRPYLDMLPQTFDMPLFWTKQQAMELKGSQVSLSVPCSSVQCSSQS